MVKKHYNWECQTLDEHSKKKHLILKEYFHAYLLTKCKIPQHVNFKLAIIDGFSGTGIYGGCKSEGSPIIFIEVLKKVVNEINIQRRINKFPPMNFEIYLHLNDSDQNVLNCLKENLAPYLADINANNENINLYTEFTCGEFNGIYRNIEKKLLKETYYNVFFNLDQYGHSAVDFNILHTIMHTFKSPEIILTFAIDALSKYLPYDKNKLTLNNLPKNLIDTIYTTKDNKLISKKSWVGFIEKALYDDFNKVSNFRTTFAINNPKGYKYWLLHFTNHYQGRQVFNDVLHTDQDTQIHVGKVGLNMFSYSIESKNQEYIFDQNSRDETKKILPEDLSKYFYNKSNPIKVEEFFKNIYSDTIAHSDDIKSVLLENGCVEIHTGKGGTRQRSNTIKPKDTIIIKPQRSFYFINTKLIKK